MQVQGLIDYNGKKLIIRRTFKEHHLKPGFDVQTLKEWTRSDILLRKDGVLYCCEIIQEAEIIEEITY